MDDDFKSLLLLHSDPREIIRKCMPDLVKKLDLEPVLDHVIAADVLSDDHIDEYEMKKGVEQQQTVNRWFLRRIVLKGSSQLSQQLIMAIYNTQCEVTDHCELVKLLREKLSGSVVAMETELPTQSSFTQPATDPSLTVDLSVQSIVDPSITGNPSLQSTVDPSIQFTVDPSITGNPSLQSAVDPSVQSTVDPSVQSTVDPSVQSTLDPSVQSTIDPSVQFTVDPSVQSTVDPSVQSTVDPSVQSTVDPSVQSTLDPSVQFTVDPSVQSTVDPSVQSTVDPPVQSTVDPSIQSTVDPTIQSTVDPSTQSTDDPSVQSTVDPSVQSTVDPSVQSTVDLPVQSTVDPSVQSTVDPSVQSTVDPSVQSTVDPLIQSTVDPSVQSTVDPSVQSTVDPSVQSTVDSSIQSTVDPPVQSTVDPSVQSTVDPPVQSTVDPSVQSTVDPPVQSTVDPSVQSTVDSSIQSTVDPPVQSTVDPSVQSTVDPPVQSTVDPSVQSTVDPPVQSTVDPSVQSTVDSSIQSTVDPPVQSTADPSVQSTVDPPVQSTVDPSAQSTVDSLVQSTVDPSIQSTVDPSVQSTVDPSVQSTVDSSVQSTVDPPVQSTVDPPVQSTVDPSAMDTSVTMDTPMDTSEQCMVPTDHVIHKPPQSFSFIMPDGKKSRDYQRELAGPGMEGINYIVCAPTGTGKTLIASMVVANHLAKRPDGKVLFLVNKVPLAEQQCQEVKQYIPDLQAQFITGDSGIQLSLAQLLRDNNMVVCTDGVFLNELRTSLLSSAERLSLTDITLLIIDECHNAKKNSPYAMIMEQYVKIKMESGDNGALPQIMGLTASPGAGENPQGEVEKTLEHLLNLCALMDAEGGIKVVKKHKVELVHFSNQPDFDLLKTKQRSPSDPFLRLLLSTMKTLESWAAQNFGISCPHSRQHQAYENWVVSQRQQSELRYGAQERDLRVALNHLQCYYNALKMYLELNQDDSLAILKEKIVMTAEEKATQSELKFQQVFSDFIDQASLIPSEENPMLVRLRQLLEKQFEDLPTTQGIIFATTKDTAQRMCRWLQGIPQLQSVIKSAVVTGQSKEEIGGMTLQKQRSTIDKFRDDNLNLLVATTVLEEGLDVAACNLVVRYNHVTNEIARVQAQGRARAKGSRCYAIMVMDSPKVLQEQMNKEKGDLTLEAMEFLPEGDKLGEEIRTRQEQLLKDRQRQEKLKEELKTQDSCDVELLCKGCDTVICELTDIRVVAESHHVVIGDKINERCIKRGPSSPITKGDIQLGKKVFCATCEKEWGVMMKWPHYGVHYPAIKCKFVLFRHANGEKQYYKQWKSIPFTIDKYK